MRDRPVEFIRALGFLNLNARDDFNVLKEFFRREEFDDAYFQQQLELSEVLLQNTFSHDLSALFAGGRSIDLAEESTSVLVGSFSVANDVSWNLFNILALIAFAYCVIKIFFANIKRGGILLVQMAVGALYLFSVPRGYQDGFNQWMKQIAALCLTAFLQTSLLFLGLLTFPDRMLLGLGIMLAANEVPRIAQQFGLDSSVRINMMSVVHATTTAVNLTRSVARAAK